MNVDVAMSVFNKQIVPIITNGCIFSGLSVFYDQVYLDNIAKNIKTFENINTLFRSGSLNLRSRFGTFGGHRRAG